MMRAIISDPVCEDAGQGDAMNVWKSITQMQHNVGRSSSGSAYAVVTINNLEHAVVSQ